MRRDTMDNVEPKNMSYEQLKKITNGFSDDCVVGRGTFGVVYKGVDKDGKIIAVKKLNPMQGVDDMEFHREFNNLTKLKHKNIVPFLGFCNESERVTTEYQGKNIIAHDMHRALCFEYMKNGSLQNHLYEEHQGFDWQARYKIIKGICEGLKHLHTGLERPVLHLDLKPDNILLDDNMVPKIADFGLSRLIIGATSTKNTTHFVGTLGYLPPEFIKHQTISPKFDIFSLGVIIIQIMCGTDGYYLFHDKKPDRFTKNVHQNWKERLEAIEGYASLDRDCQQVKNCLIIALKCLEPERENRPDIEYIVNHLYETEKYTNSVPYGMEQVTSLVKVGLWGGRGGSPRDISTLPQRLTSWMIRSDDGIHAIEFTYVGINGEDCNSGHWGGSGGTPKKIELRPGEYVREVSGTNGPFATQKNQITSLNIITNDGTYSYGQPVGTNFSIPVENGQIVGFYARSGACLDAIGLYILP